MIVPSPDGWSVNVTEGMSAGLVAALAAGRSWAAGTHGSWLGGPAPADLSERSVNVDQTQLSVIVGDSVVVKWTVAPTFDESPALRMTSHLAAVGFTAQPPPLGELVLDDPPVLLAAVTGYLPGAQDGWDWYVDDVRAHARGHAVDVLSPAQALGSLTAELHVALATPSVFIPAPRETVTAAEVNQWRARALASLDEAIAVTLGAEGEHLQALAPRARAILENLESTDATVAQPIHGDLHVGQILRWAGGYVVNDFDGNPVLRPSERLAPQPTARDVAGMLQSLDHVGRVALRHAPDAAAKVVEHWIEAAQGAFLLTYQATLAELGASDLFDQRLLKAFAVEQECREYVYAARHLPRWLYVPDAALPALLARDGA